MSSTTERGTGASEASLAELIKQLSETSSRLARQEVELAKAELAYKGKRAGIGAGMFGGAGVFGFYGLGALIIAVVLGAIAGILAMQGKSKVQQATPPVPEEATESVKEDVQWAKTKAQQARQ